MNSEKGHGEEGQRGISARAGEATRRLAEFASSLRFEDLPPEVVAHTRLLALDAIGCCLFGSTLPWTRKLADMVGEEGGEERCTVVGAEYRTSASHAVLVNSSACHAFESDDTHKPSFFHPGSICMPVALAMAETCGNRSGRDFLTAMVAGYEVGTRVGMGATMSLFYRGWHPQGTTGTFVSAATAANMLRLSADEAQDALGIAGTQSSGLMSAQEGAMVKRMHSGRAAQAGVYGALLARRGFTGISNVVEADFGGFLSTLSDSPDPERVLRGLGREWETLVVGFKPFCSVASIHAALYTLREMMKAHDLTADDIDHLHAGVHRMTHVHCAWPYNAQDVTAAQMNLFYGLAVIALEGEAFVDQYQESRLSDPAILRLVRRMTAEVDPEIEARGPGGRHAVKLKLTAFDGRVFEAAMDFSPGSPDCPLTEGQIVQKFRAFARHGIEEHLIDDIVDIVLRMDSTPDLRPLCMILAQAEPQFPVSGGTVK